MKTDYNNRTPLALIIDDPAPRVFVYYEHADSRILDDGRPLVDQVPNSFMEEFCEIIETYGIKGKFSIVPMPGGRGDILNGIPGFPQEEIDDWLDMARNRVAKYFSICPEMLTHAGAVDLSNGKIMDINEEVWSRSQDRQTLTPYITKALTLLKDAGFSITGISSPWGFGRMVEDEYVFAIAEAMYNVFGKADSWYFTWFDDNPSAVPTVTFDNAGRRVVSIPATIYDYLWETMHTTDTSEEYISSVINPILSEDGTSGKLIEILDGGGIPVILTHWQSLFSNGSRTGLTALTHLAQRIQNHLAHRVEWVTHEELMKMTLKSYSSVDPHE